MMNKEECSEVLTRLLRPYFASTEIQNAYHDINKGYSIDHDSNILTLLIKEHFELIEKYKLNCEFLEEQYRFVAKTFDYLEKHLNPQPYKFEDLKIDMWVWDDANEDCRQIAKINEQGGIYWHGVLTEYEADKFEEGRFFSVKKALEYQR